MTTDIIAHFTERFGRHPILIAAPGRINFIGEHTDYNEGFVLPAAVDKRIYVAIAENGTNTVNVFASQLQEAASFECSDSSPRKGWINYLIGVTHYIQQTGGKVRGVDVWIDGDIPVGAGMSSSAALCSGFGFALNHLFQLDFTRMELAYIGQKTEHNFVGVKCGIMDQFASLHGKAGHAMKLDCRSMEFEYVPFNFPDHKIVLINSMVKHELASSEYNVRREQCEEGVHVLQKYYPEIKSLRDVTYEQLTRHWKEFHAVVYDRCSYVVNENQRLLAACDALRRNELHGLGEMMYASHKGLSKRYNVSCKELDLLVDLVKGQEGVIGARMMGGGFGGCTINIVHANNVERILAYVKHSFTEKIGIEPEAYVMQLEDGVKIID